MVTWVDSIASLDFDTVLTGDGTTATKAAVVELGGYFDALVRDVGKGYAAGRSLDQVKAEKPTQGWEIRYGSKTGPWTTDRFIEAAYASLKKTTTQTH